MIINFSNLRSNIIIIILQVPNVCCYQYLNYTIFLEEIDIGNVSPLNFIHQEPGSVSRIIDDGLKQDTNYSFWVHVDSTAGSSTSDKYYVYSSTYTGT